jgi:hypothetical protein
MKAAGCRATYINTYNIPSFCKLESPFFRNQFGPSGNMFLELLSEDVATIVWKIFLIHQATTQAIRTALPMHQNLHILPWESSRFASLNFCQDLGAPISIARQYTPDYSLI